MNFVKKLNIISIIFALVLFVNIELMLNVYRISRITRCNLGAVIVIVSIVEIFILIFCTILFYKLIKNWMQGLKSGFLAIILWLPYFIFFTYIFAALFPITFTGDKPNPVSGLIIIGELIFYPIFLTILYSISNSFSNKEKLK